MAEKKKPVKKSATKPKAAKPSKVSLEELQKKREEVLKRINAEIGEETESITEETIEKKEDNALEEIEEPTEDAEHRTDDVEVKDEVGDNEDVGVVAADEIRDEVEKTDEERPLEDRDDADREMPEKPEHKEKADEEEIKIGEPSEKEESSPFSAAEFGVYEGSKKRKLGNILLFLVVFALVAAASAFAYFYFVMGAPEPENQPPPTQTIPTETPTPTPAVTFNRGGVSVQVLNGAGTSGVAGTMAELLEEKGYENIDTGNADEFDYENVTIQLKEEYEEFFSEIVSDVESEYTVNEEYESLDEESEFDIVIIVGSEVEEPDEDEDE